MWHLISQHNFLSYKGNEESVHWLPPLSSSPRCSYPAQDAMNSQCSSDSLHTFTGTHQSLQFTHNSNQQLQFGFCYKRETCNIKIPQKQVKHQEGTPVDDTVTGFSLYILLCCFFCSIKSMHSCFELRSSYLWLERVTSMAGNWTKSRTDHTRNYHRNHTASGSKPTSLRAPQAARTQAHLLLTNLTTLHMAAF